MVAVLATMALATVAVACGSSAGPSSTAPATSTAVGPPLGAVPDDFAPASVSFPTAERGFVLGRSSCGSSACTSLVVTGDGGTSWGAVAAPSDPLVAPAAAAASASGVSRVRFSSELDGWVFGPDLWATHDGGATWRQQAVDGRVVDLATDSGITYALVSHCPDGPCPQGATLLQTPAGSDQWQPVEGVTLAPTGGQLALRGRAAWVAPTGSALEGGLVATSPDGSTWSTAPVPCPSGSRLVGLAAPDAQDVYYLCGGNAAAGTEAKTVFRSTDGGLTAHRDATDPPLGGIAQSLTATDRGLLAVAARSGATLLYVSPDAGRSWTTPVNEPDSGAGLVDLAFTTDTQGVAISGPPGEAGAQLRMTHDAGATWPAVTL